MHGQGSGHTHRAHSQHSLQGRVLAQRADQTHSFIQIGAVPGRQRSESGVQGEEAPGWGGWERGATGEGARTVCRLRACVCSTGSETRTRCPEGSVILRLTGPQPRARGQGQLWRERLGRGSGRRHLFSTPSVNTKKPHPELQTDLQKSILNFRLGRSVGAKWLEAQDGVPRFRTPDRCHSQSGPRYQPLTFLPLSIHLHKHTAAGYLRRNKGSSRPTLVFNLPNTFLQDLLFFKFSNTWEILIFWKLNILGLGLAAYKRKNSNGLNKIEFCFLLT